MSKLPNIKQNHLMQALALLAVPACDACVAQYTGLTSDYVRSMHHQLAKEDVVLRYYQRICRQCGKRRRVNELASKGTS